MTTKIVEKLLNDLSMAVGGRRHFRRLPSDHQLGRNPPTSVDGTRTGHKIVSQSDQAWSASDRYAFENYLGLFDSLPRYARSRPLSAAEAALRAQTANDDVPLVAGLCDAQPGFITRDIFAAVRLALRTVGADRVRRLRRHGVTPRP